MKTVREVIDTAITQFGSRKEAPDFILSALKEEGFVIVYGTTICPACKAEFIPQDQGRE